jgi:hypothetical protein
VFDLAINSIQVSYAFTPTLKLHISIRIEIKAKIHGWSGFQTPLSNLSVPSEELRQVFFSNHVKTFRKFELNQSRQKVSI